jgi:hypothetical protein
MTESAQVNSGFLKNVRSGRVIRRTDILASRTDMVPCDVNGKTDGQYEADLVRAGVANGRVKTKYLGSTKNGVLYNYSDILAERVEMLSINSIEQWENYKKTGMAPKVSPATVAPVLKREVSAVTPVPPAAPDEPNIVMETGINAIPSIDKLGIRAAKTTLSEWAELNYNQKLDRRLPLPELVNQCKAFLDQDGKAVAAG